MVGPTKNMHRDFATAAAIFLLIAICTARPFFIDAQGLWLDELYTFSLLTGFDPYLFPGSDLTNDTTVKTVGAYLSAINEDRFSENFERNITHEGHPPVYYLTMKAWAELFGYSEAALRAFSCFTFFVTLPFVYSIARSTGGRAGAFYATALFSALPIQMAYSMEARGYSLAMLFTACATFFFLRINSAQDTSSAKAFGWIVSAFLAMMTHYYSLIFLAGLASFYLVSEFIRAQTVVISKTSVSILIPFLLFMLWLPMLSNQTKAHGDSHWTQGSTDLLNEMISVISSVGELVTGSQVVPFPWALLIIGFGVLTAVLASAVVAYKTGGSAELALCFSVFFCLAGVVVVDYLLDKKTAGISRYIIFLCIPLSALAGNAFRSIHRARLPSLVVLAALCFISIQVALGTLSPKQMVKESVHYVEANKGGRAITLISPSGPLVVGMAIYAEHNSLVAGVSPTNIDDRTRRLLDSGFDEVWVIEQRLGLETEPWTIKDGLKASSTARFVGVDVKVYRR